MTPTHQPAGALGFALNVRFTDQQRQLLQAIANEVERPLSAIVRDVVMSWAIGHQVEIDALTHEQVLQLVAELQQPEDQP